MGLEQSVTFSEENIPRWSDVNGLLERNEYPVQIRMIDGELALPDDVVPDAWKELRVGTPPGMVTLKRHPQKIVFVAWSNADDAMKEAWNALTWAYAKLGNGRVNGNQDLPAFQRAASLPPQLKKVK